MTGSMLTWMLALTLALASEDHHEREGHEREDHDDDEDEDEDDHEGGGGAVVTPATDPVWQSECGSCHLAYSPGLLPARSWDSLLSSLDRHFGEDASVAPEVRARLAAIAAAGAAERSTAPLSKTIVRSSIGITPARLFDVPYLAHEHDEVSFRSATAPRPSACAACHSQAASGRFSESEIRRPARAPVPAPVPAPIPKP